MFFDNVNYIMDKNNMSKTQKEKYELYLIV